jgi:Leucine-rich repeat (LRR) protein
MSYEGVAKLCKALPGLDYFSLSKNDLDSLPPELCIPKLEYLDLYDNNITSFPVCFYQSKTIRIIHFTGSIADGVTIPPPIDLDIQGMRDKFRKAGRRVSIE